MDEVFASYDCTLDQRLMDHIWEKLSSKWSVEKKLKELSINLSIADLSNLLDSLDKEDIHVCRICHQIAFTPKGVYPANAYYFEAYDQSGNRVKSPNHGTLQMYNIFKMYRYPMDLDFGKPKSCEEAQIEDQVVSVERIMES